MDWIDCLKGSPMDWASLPILDSYSDFLEEKCELSFTLDLNEVAIFPEYKWDPVGFMTQILGVEPWICQREIAELVRDHPRVSVAACYASGKTFLAACLVLWWLFTRPSCLVVSTAPTGRQVKELLWAEIAMLHTMSRVPLGGKILTRETRLDKHRRGYGVAGDGKSTNAGYHDKSGCVLFIVDEKAGMKKDTLQDFDGLLVDDEECRELGIGNPVSTSGPFYEEHTNAKYASSVKLYSISALMTPNLTGEGEDRKKYPGLVSRSWIENKRKIWGESHPMWITKVLGRFFVAAGQQRVIPTEWVAAAQQRWSELGPEQDEVDILAADVAAAGQNKTVLRRLKGRRITLVDSWSGDDTNADPEDVRRGTMKTAEKIVQWAEKLGVKRLCVDSQGLGIGICDRITEFIDAGRMRGVTFYPVAMGDSAHDSANYHRIVDEVQFNMRRAFDPDNPKAVAIDPNDEVLADQLTWRKWNLVGDGEDNSVIKVTRKRDLIKEGHESPDDADAASLLFYVPDHEEGGFFFI